MLKAWVIILLTSTDLWTAAFTLDRIKRLSRNKMAVTMMAPMIMKRAKGDESLCTRSG